MTKTSFLLLLELNMANDKEKKKGVELRRWNTTPLYFKY